MNNKKIIIATHVWAHGPAQDLRKYLRDKKANTLLFISHPLFYDKRINGDGYEIFSKGKHVKSYYHKIRKIPSVISYVKDALLTIYFVINQKNVYDLFLGFNNLNAFAGLLLKKMGKVKKCVYYVVDYTPIRFENSILNKLYHYIETFCALKCDETWNLSHRMIEAREELKGIESAKCGIQKVVPMGIWYDNLTTCCQKKINFHQLVYVGHIIKKQGIQHIIKAIPEILKSIKDFKFIVIGTGEYLKELKRMALEYSIEKHVFFMGYIDSNNTVNKIISCSGLAVALYEEGDKKKNWTYYADPGKIKLYIGAGVPIILTAVPPNAQKIQEEECGLIVKNDYLSIANSIISIMKNRNVQIKFRNNAIRIGKEYNWEVIFAKAFKDVFNNRQK